MAKKAIRPIRIEGNVAFVPLTQGYEAVIDAADVPLVEGRNWFAHVRRRPDNEIWAVYAASNKEGPRSSKRGCILMHRIIADTGDGLDADHRDRDGLNNRRENLRNATRAQNRHNSRVRVDSESGVKGVSWDKSRGAWSARIKVGGKLVYLGRFADIDAAADAYAKASRKLHGEFGRTE